MSFSVSSFNYFNPLEYECKLCYQDVHLHSEILALYEEIRKYPGRCTDLRDDIISTYHAIVHLSMSKAKLVLWFKTSLVLKKLYAIAKNIRSTNRRYGMKVLALVKNTMKKR